MKKKQITQILWLMVLTGSFLYQCTAPGKEGYKNPVRSQVQHPAWTRNAVIYEVNIRQYTPEGTFRAFESHLPRLKELGIDVLWLMPVNPIGVKNRKGVLGSYYSVKDYMSINPEFGTMDDFKHLVDQVHQQGMKIIIDWVPNHSSWDNPLTVSHPEFYLHDSLGGFVSPFDWTDVIRFDYSNPGLRKYMTDAMKWWYTQTGIDGFRCDVAHMVPVDFWNDLRASLDSIRPVFLVAEADQPFLHEKAFDVTYDWKFHHIMNSIASGKMDATMVKKHFAWVDSVYPGDSYLMQFTSNHDENSWNGTEYERMGDGALCFAVLAATIPDIPLVYTGQEAGLNKRLKFFEKDTINWGNYSLTSFYQKLIGLKKRNNALRNGDGGRPVFLSTGRDSAVVAFVRKGDDDKILVLCNLSPLPQAIVIKNDLLPGEYNEVFTGNLVRLKRKWALSMKPWEYMVFELVEKK